MRKKWRKSTLPARYPAESAIGTRALRIPGELQGAASSGEIRRFLTFLAGSLLISVASATAQGDPTPPQQAPAAAEAPTAQPETTPEVPPAPPPAPAPDYFFPDLAPKALVHDGKYFWFRPVFAAVLDYTWFEQDDSSLEQVGKQDDTGELRAGRVGGTLRWKGDYKWDFYSTLDYQERETREGAVFQVFDMKIGLPIGAAKLDIGKMKEPIAYELTALSVLLPQQERILNPFYPTRSIGVRLSGPLWGDRITWSAGAFNDSFDTHVGQGEAGNDYVGRLTALAWESTDKNDFLHLGLGYRRAGSDDGLMRFSGRPETNVSDKYVDTGNFPADHADEVSYEVLVQHGPYSVLAERFDAAVDSPATGDPRFSGYYVAGSWILTGESRHYIRATGHALGLLPKSRYGALELVAKYSRVDLSDGTLDGGVLDKWYFGLSWWTSTQWKIGLSWGDADLDKSGLVGNTKILLLRMQWLY